MHYFFHFTTADVTHHHSQRALNGLARKVGRTAMAKES